MSVVRGEMGWTRAFRNIGWPHIVYSGRLTQGMSGGAVWIHRKIAGALVGYEPISDRVLVRLKVKPRNITLIQVR